MSPLDDQVRETLNRTLDSLRGHVESEFASCQENLLRAAEEVGTRIAAEAAQAASAEARTEFERQLAEARDSAARDAEVAARDADARQQDAETRREQAEAELATAASHLEVVERSLREIEQKSHLQADEIAAAHEHAAQLKREVSRLNDAVRLANSRVTEALRLPHSIRALDAASTLGEVLDSLVQDAGREAGRAAVFLVKGERLRDWRAIGFDLDPESRLDFGFDESGPLADVVRSGQAVANWDGHDLPSFARGNGSRRATAWPIAVGGSVVAVLYADGFNADISEEPYWPAFLEVLATHAGRVLEAITLRRAAGLAPPRPLTDSPTQIEGHQPAGSLQ